MEPDPVFPQMQTLKSYEKYFLIIEQKGTLFLPLESTDILHLSIQGGVEGSKN